MNYEQGSQSHPIFGQMPYFEDFPDFFPSYGSFFARFFPLCALFWLIFARFLRGGPAGNPAGLLETGRTLLILIMNYGDGVGNFLAANLSFKFILNFFHSNFSLA
jgi:hypothetical protein